MPMDPLEYRKALGSFTTGVTVITTRGADGRPVGLTANSFNSVSLSPPLVLWSLAQSSRNLPTFRAADHWAVHVLATDQQALSARFAQRSEDKFAGLLLETGLENLPLLPTCAARFQCRSAFQYEGGDHVIFVGEVLAFDRSDSAPLVFHGGQYAHATRREANETSPRSAWLDGSFNEGFLGYLLGRAHFQMFARIRPALAAENLSSDEFHLLSTLTLQPRLGAKAIEASVGSVMETGIAQVVQALMARGLVQADSSPPEVHYVLGDAGRESALRVIAAAKAVESEVLEQFGAGDAAAIKALLSRLLRQLDPATVTLWGEGKA